MTLTLRGELRCFACARYLGEFESHPETHGNGDIHLIPPEIGELAQHAIKADDGFRCSRCGGRAVAYAVERVAA